MLWEDNYLAHFGIKGQKWGIRRFQNADGSLTAEGKKRYEVHGFVSRQKSGPPRHAKSGPMPFKAPNYAKVENTDKKTNAAYPFRTRRQQKIDRKLEQEGIIERFSERDRNRFDYYSRSSQNSIIDYMKKNPKASFNQADKYDTKKSLIKGAVGLGISLAAMGIFYSKMNKQKTMAKAVIHRAGPIAFPGAGAAQLGFAMKGHEYIEMMKGRAQWMKWT